MPFIVENMNKNLRKILTKWRLSSHNLEIEMGRRKGVARELRYCNFCDNRIEDYYIGICVYSPRNLILQCNLVLGIA